jgi:hypothetical protein
MASQETDVQIPTAELLEAVRDADWPQALSILELEQDLSAIRCPSTSLVAWFIELNAPPDVVVACMAQCAKNPRFEANRLGLLERCIEKTNSNSNAFPTFKALLAAGLNPNSIVEGGDTLFQHAIGLNRMPEVEELLRYGIDPHQMNIFGPESTSNIDGAKQAGNTAGDLAFATLRSRA